MRPSVAHRRPTGHRFQGGWRPDIVLCHSARGAGPPSPNKPSLMVTCKSIHHGSDWQANNRSYTLTASPTVLCCRISAQVLHADPFQILVEQLFRRFLLFLSRSGILRFEFYRKCRIYVYSSQIPGKLSHACIDGIAGGESWTRRRSA